VLLIRRDKGGQIAQEVRIIDSEGVPWQDLYTVEHETGGRAECLNTHWFMSLDIVARLGAFVEVVA
jgi:hypothetical protein